MALVVCGTCKANIASSAAACPRCGARRASSGTSVVAGIVGLVVIALVAGHLFSPSDKANDGIPVAAPDVDLSKGAAAPIAPVAGRVATPPQDFRGHLWGSKPTRDMKAEGPVSDDADRLQVFTLRGPSPSFLGVPVQTEAYEYTRSRLYGGQLFVDGTQNLTAMRDALMAEFGRPGFANPKNNVYVWTWDKSKVRAQFYYDTTRGSGTVDIKNEGI